MEGFYKYFADDNSVIHAPNFVINKDWELWIANKDSYEYPVDGWYYFSTEEEAHTFFNYTPPEVI